MSELWRFDAIGTRWEIETAEPVPDAVRTLIAAVIDGFDEEWSRFRPDSLVSRLAVHGGEAAAPADAAAMLDVYRELDAATAGAVNPLVGESLARRGYDAAYSFVDRGAAPAPAWQRVLEWDAQTLRLGRPALLDVGALGKGRLVDLVAEILAGSVTGGFVVDASGDMAVRGGPVRVGLEHPFDPSRAIGVFEVEDAALCASAVNRRAWGEGLHHVLDARTGVPVRTIAATWALASDAMHADAAATALFFDGGPELAADWGVSWVRMTTDGTVEWSADQKAELFL
ncbi:thiamine biosynthesis lipoprotein [Microbacterium sp. SORGH_AS428]|uniref:FAD:protein FMN transferase n=1 Tax=Microbacterium sp. SORGH_AS_0428 TaxID=3041788 RepID=UPI00286422B6|nr:FAD:protein FMN transferase [Microbacterium sp. SORGH_AS_0428]MDR6201026.1 thiamine biosynthesis lipoprotein [Microbacterium sp. SORGH_AS_0428]